MGRGGGKGAGKEGRGQRSEVRGNRESEWPLRLASAATVRRRDAAGPCENRNGRAAARTDTDKHGRTRTVGEGRVRGTLRSASVATVRRRTPPVLVKTGTASALGERSYRTAGGL